MDVLLLGDIEVHHGGQRIDVGPRRERGLLALLMLEIGTVLSLDRLAAMLWDGSPPTGYRDAMYVHMARLRKRLPVDAGLRLLTRRGGYFADGDPVLVDAHRFRSLVDQARVAADPSQRVARLSRALGLWRGPALADVLTDPARSRVTAHLAELRRSAIEDLYQAELDRGRHRDIIAGLSAALTEHWPNERLTAQLMLALHRTGRQTDALEVYQAHRTRLADDYGTDPGEALQRVHAEILRDDLTTDAARTGSRTMPRQLPHPARVFVGRAAELERLDRIIATHGDAPGASTIVLSGPPGVGKTALALHWAHGVVDRFPDGQLYVNLRGYDNTAPMSAAGALGTFLRALGADPAGVPSHVDERAALYRTLLSGRRMLVVLDNARRPDQIRPLLPGAGGCLALVTSRNALSGLALREGADRIVLDRLSTVESGDVLRRVLGSDRVDARPDAAADLARRCYGLPLALRVVAERIAARPGVDLAALAAELADRAHRLHALAVGDDPSSAVRAVLAWSYDAIPPAAARLWRLLGLHPVPEFSVAAAAGLAGIPVRAARSLLDVLADEHLAEAAGTGRYRMHDLVHLYAGERVHRDESDAALRRLVDFYLHTARAGDRLIEPQRPPIELDPIAPDTTTVALADAAAALAWLDREHETLLAIAGRAADHGWHRLVAHLAVTLDAYHRRRGPVLDNVRTLAAGHAAAQRTGDVDLRARCARDLGHAHGLAHQPRQAERYLFAALDTYRTTDDVEGQAHVHEMLSCAYGREGRDRAALAHATKALRLFQTLDDPLWTALALNGVGWFCAKLHHPRAAQDLCGQALALYRSHGDRKGEANALDALGFAAFRAGDHERALASYRGALDIMRELGDRFAEAGVLHHIGEAHDAADESALAHDAWRQALALYEGQHRLAEAKALRDIVNRGEKR